MGLIDRFVSKVADQVASRLGERGTLNVERATPAAVQAAFNPPSGFPPGTPLTPREPAGTPPREWQYPVGFNLNVTPRATEPVGFAMLRNLADLCDLVRIAIEMRKNDLVRLDWTITAKQKGDSDRYQAEIAAARTFFESPDRENDWGGWLRMLLEDMLVLDAASLYRRRTRAGQLYALEVVDGSTIKPLLDGRGRTPQPPLPAYQQILYGFPSTEMTRDELLYLPKNKRARSAYGSSPVEWILLAINWYMRREQFNVSYYTASNIPEGFISAPEGWSPEQIRQFEEYMNLVLTGNVEQLRKLRFVGHGFTFTRFRDMNFEVAHEEWLARVITAAFGVNYQRFVQRVVRATAEAAASQTADEGLEPDKKFISGLITRILATDLGLPFLKHEFIGGETQDEAAETAKNVQYVGAGIRTRDEVRVSNGDAPMGLPLTSGLTVTTPSGVVALDAAAVPPTSAAASDPTDRPDPTDQAAAEKAVQADLAKWRRKALKAVREGKAERASEFTSAAIAPAVHATVTARLAAATTEADVLAAFETKAAAPAPPRPRATAPRRTPDRSKQQDPEALRRIQDIVARRFRAQAPAVVARAHTLADRQQ